MAKRPLGLGKKNREKRRKLEDSAVTQSSDDKEKSPTPSNQIDIELKDNTDPDNELHQLEGLWLNYFNSDREDEMLLNGIVHECDRLLREAKLNNQSAIEKQIAENEIFYAIYALALSELTIFKSGEEEDSEKKSKLIAEFFENAIDRCEAGLTNLPDSELLNLVHSKIILQRIPLQYISTMKLDSKKTEKLDLLSLFELAKKKYFNISKHADLSYEVLIMMNDLLDIIENFGHENEIEEGLDSDNEEDLEMVELSEEHPLFDLQTKVSENYDWLREKLSELTGLVSAEDNKSLFHNIHRTAGELFLKQAEEPALIFMQQYDNDEPKVDVSKLKKAQKESLDLTTNALKYLKKAQIEDEPKTWVQVAEAYIDLGNLHDYKSKEQENAYSEAEKILTRANKATNGKFQIILDNLLEN
ncbi:hypothetical protein TPHA_0J01280 [Tetrapisispora phaffii CBS 4417]|uniref:Enhancer of translation termination 1 n=1 Tax=Tetrapisispora phaffii (strain ATCC 24235 / CBS 4417 / NBRC 1672 / NRRL Y-8282 / UCD 70-5) TaxID=1071381 RepID=G8BYK8_TETPH|nr:hypothetical protein TPHA_0J01280 [Tetrapisispora phaffii CBS 4417]CCE64950.1 hypothetical protein TPHA_0J01280 [Tetrapisispora phaffii CBS 4417]